MEFTFWEAKSIELPKRPLYGILVFLALFCLVGALGWWAGSLTTTKKAKSTGPTLQELEGYAAVVQAATPQNWKPLDEMLRKSGDRIGVDLAKWTLISRWKSEAMFDLYRTDLLSNLTAQIAELKQALEAEKAAARGGGAAEPAPAKP